MKGCFASSFIKVYQTMICAKKKGGITLPMNIGIYKVIIVWFFFSKIWLPRPHLSPESTGRTISEGSDRVRPIESRSSFCNIDTVMIDSCQEYVIYI